MKIKINIDKVQDIVWPTTCALCGLPTREREGKARLHMVDSKYKSMPWIGWTDTIFSIRYPLCSSHRIIKFILWLFTMEVCFYSPF